ncbi:MAG: hypothetical protein ACR2PF_16845 [Rhizobiaceae bacterium]
MGYSSRIEVSPAETRSQISAHLASLEHCIIDHYGQVIDTAGDGIFDEFPQLRAALG